MSARHPMLKLIVVACGVLVAVPALAQDRRAAGAPRPDPRVVARYQVVVMEGALEAAVQLGARLLGRQLQSGTPQMTLMGGNARARGFRLDGYGVFFDVDVPRMSQSFLWSWRMLDRDGAGAGLSLEPIKRLAAAVTDPVQKRELEQIIRSVELRVGAVPSVAEAIRAGDPAAPGATTTASAPARGGAQPAPSGGAASRAEPEFDPDTAYTDAVRDALIDAMLSYSQHLGIGEHEFLTVAARDSVNPRLTGEDPADVTTVFIRVKGSDLKALHEGRLTRDEARARVEVREY